MLLANRRTSNRRAARQTFRPRFEPLESRIMLSAAVLSGWVGLNNTAGANDYEVISSTSAGGTFQSRSAVEAELSDAALLGGPFGFDTDLFMSGTLAFANPDDAPANFFFGFYDSAGTTFPNTPRLGLSLGNQSADFFRMQSVANNGSTTVTNNLNFGSGTAGEPLAAGTYPFHFTYTASNRQLSATVGPLTRTVTLAAGFNQADVLDRFGFRQWPTTPVSDIAFALTVSDINYTGETQVTGPPTEPAAPTGLAATAGEGQVSLTWQDNSDNETGFAIERRVGSDGTWHPLATVPANVTSYTDLGLAPETTYYYRLRAFHVDLFSEWSNKASATTPVAPPQDHLIPAHGEYSQTYLESWETLPSGKEIVQARPEPPPAIAVMDGMHNGVDYREVPVVDGVATLKDLHLELSWTQGESQVHDRPSVSTMWFFTGMDKVIIDNVTVRQMTPDKAANTIRIYNVDTVEIRNSTFEGDVRRYHIMLHGVKNIFIDGVKVKGDAEGNAGGGIAIENGGGRASGQPIPLGPLEWLVIQNSYFHDATTIAGGPTAGNRDAILVHTFNNGVIFNNTFENWIHSAKEGSTAIDAAVDIGLRVAHPPEHEAITRVERNQFINNTFVKSNGSAGGDTDLRHHLLWVNNEFLNTGLVDYHANFTVHYVHNTFVFDAAKSGPKLTTIFPFHTWFGSAPDGSHVKVFNNIISQKEITGPFTPFRLYEQRASDGNAQSHHLTLTADYNWIAGTVPRWMQTGGSGGWVSTTYEDWKTRGLPRTVFDEHSRIGPVNFADYENNGFWLAGVPDPPFDTSPDYTAAEQPLVALRVLRDFNGATRGATPTAGAYRAELAPLPGDYSNSGTVGHADYEVWAQSFGSTTNLAADGNGNGRIDAADYTVWRDHLGASRATGPAIPAVPDEDLAFATVPLREARPEYDGVLQDGAQPIGLHAFNGSSLAESDGEESRLRVFPLMGTNEREPQWARSSVAAAKTRTAAADAEAASRVARDTALLQLLANREAETFGGTTAPTADQAEVYEQRRVSSSRGEMPLLDVASAMRREWTVPLRD